MQDSPDDRPEPERAAALKNELLRWAEVPPERVRVVRSPYRVCPLGAHVDHQLGEVTGMALDRALLLAFAPREDRRVVVRSRQFKPEVRLDLRRVPEEPAGDWADYLRGAVRALLERHQLRRGISAVVDGHDDVGGLSSSAAVGVAYLLGLEAANGLELSVEENIELDRMIENDFIGLNNGILDQSSILRGRRGSLMHLDCRSGEARLVEFGGGGDICIVVLFSGLRMPLAESDYNRRVAECRQAARRLLEEADRPVPDPPVLREVPPEVFRQYGARLPEPLRRRAAHFFGEQQRVHDGLRLWAEGNLEQFGELMNQSGRSSVRNYECGNEYLRSAWEVLRDCPGVCGARFSGAGFRGCCIGLTRDALEGPVVDDALERYLERHPDMKGKAKIYFCRPADGATVLD